MAGRGAHAVLLAEIVEISALASEMASAAVGLRGAEKRKAMTAAKRARDERRWSSVCAMADTSRGRIKPRLVQQFRERAHLLLTQDSLKPRLKQGS